MIKAWNSSSSLKFSGKANRDLSAEPIHNVAGLLKHYFKESKDPLLGYENYEGWVSIAGMPLLALTLIQGFLQKPDQALAKIKTLLQELNTAEPLKFRIFHAMVQFLDKIILKARRNFLYEKYVKDHSEW